MDSLSSASRGSGAWRSGWRPARRTAFQKPRSPESSLENIARAPALRRRFASHDQRPARLYRIDILAPRDELRRPQPEIDPAAQPLRPGHLPVAVQVAPGLRHLALAGKLHRPDSAQEKEEDGSAEDDQRQRARLQFSIR